MWKSQQKFLKYTKIFSQNVLTNSKGSAILQITRNVQYRNRQIPLETKAEAAFAGCIRNLCLQGKTMPIYNTVRVK